MQSQAATTVCHAPAHDAVAYARRQPEATLLYKTLQAHWLGSRVTIETEGGELPAFVDDEFEAYFRCGILAHGFLRARCKDCGHSRLLSFSCKRCGFCPSCLGRRMALASSRVLPRRSTRLLTNRSHDGEFVTRFGLFAPIRSRRVDDSTPSKKRRWFGESVPGLRRIPQCHELVQRYKSRPEAGRVRDDWYRQHWVSRPANR